MFNIQTEAILGQMTRELFQESYQRSRNEQNLFNARYQSEINNKMLSETNAKL